MSKRYQGTSKNQETRHLAEHPNIAFLTPVLARICHLSAGGSLFQGQEYRLVAPSHKPQANLLHSAVDRSLNVNGQRRLEGSRSARKSNSHLIVMEHF